ncbi:MAG: hypothetical protein WA441_03080 [Methyloceanibacter sp.]|jgi:hypothetical protein
MSFMAFMASGLLLNVAVPTIIMDLPSGFLPVTAHLWLVAALTFPLRKSYGYP